MTWRAERGQAGRYAPQLKAQICLRESWSDEQGIKQTRCCKMTFDPQESESSRARDDIMHSPAPRNSFMLRMPKTQLGGPMAAKGRIEIDAEHCKGCELCTTVCPQNVIKMSDWFNA